MLHVPDQHPQGGEEDRARQREEGLHDPHHWKQEQQRGERHAFRQEQQDQDG
jgi:hypothetical protein